MGNLMNSTTSKPMFIRYTVMPDNVVGQIRILHEMELTEVQLLLGHEIPSLRKYRLKHEYFDGEKWDTMDSELKWRAAVINHCASGTKEPLQFKCTKKPIFLHYKRLNNITKVHVKQSKGPRAKRVIAPISVNKNSTKQQIDSPKITNDELFSYIMEREPEMEYLHTRERY
ncbi:vacuolar protein sorting/targeting protein Vps10 [Acrasis kona]|uniref:Vacuolar protein sorting/targeting protein Vps10 n=1 Tax=Acrasis kona TaxID=1008807 RepID=A0AAW2YKY3_9EUKA